MSNPYFFCEDINAMIKDIPDDTIVSRTFHNQDGLRAILFGFAPGQELSEHTASVPAVIHILSGKADITLGGDSFTAGEGAWAAMPPNMPHSIHATTRVIMLLIMLK